MNKIDVHVLRLPNSNSAWYDKCLDSLKDENIILHEVAGIKGNVGQARARGFSEGSSEYVSFVDDDDWIEPGAYNFCLDVLEADQDKELSTVMTFERLVNEDGSILNEPYIARHVTGSDDILTAHHIVVYRREYVEPYLHIIERYNNHPEIILRAIVKVQNSKAKRLHIIGYNWRQRPDSWSHSLQTDDIINSYTHCRYILAHGLVR